MARMHTKKHGKSKSRKPAPQDIRVEAERSAVEELIGKYAKQGLGAAQIGQALKDKHKVLYVRPVIGKRLVKYIDEKGLGTALPYDLTNLMKKAVNMRKHISKNKQDVHNTTRLHRVESKIWRLSKYYKGTGRLPGTWVYDPEQAALMIKETR